MERKARDVTHLVGRNLDCPLHRPTRVLAGDKGAEVVVLVIDLEALLAKLLADLQDAWHLVSTELRDHDWFIRGEGEFENRVHELIGHPVQGDFAAFSNLLMMALTVVASRSRLLRVSLAFAGAILPYCGDTLMTVLRF